MSMTLLNRCLAVVATGVLTIGLTACGDDDDDTAGNDTAATDGCTGGATVDDAEADGAITVYSGRTDSLIQPLIDRFSDATGIDVDVRYGDTAEMAALIVEEGDRTRADVFLAQDAGALGAVSNQDMFAALPTETVSLVPDEYQASDCTWVGVTGRSRVMVYNPELIGETELPASVLDLTGEPWVGEVAIAPLNGSFQAFVTALRVTEGDEAAADFLAAFADAPTREKNSPIVADVAAGELTAGLVNHYYVYEAAAETGQTVEEFPAKLHYFSGGDAGALVNVSGVGVLEHAAADPDAAAFVDYLLSVDAQTYFTDETFEYPLIDGVPGPAGQPSLADLDPPAIDLNDLDDLEATVAMIQAAGLA